MTPLEIRFHHDYVDPASYLVRASLVRLGAAEQVDHRPFELRRSSAPPIDPASPKWREYVSGMARLAEDAGVPFGPPAAVPWSAKAHELALHAREIEPDVDVHGDIYEAYFAQGRDIGRVDVLVAIAEAAGLDPTETKAVLDVDRFSHRIVEERQKAIEMGVRGVPTLVLGSTSKGPDLLEGFHTEDEIGTFLQRAAGRP